MKLHAPPLVDLSSPVGRSYYCFALELALTAIRQAQALAHGLPNHDELAKIEQRISVELEKA